MAMNYTPKQPPLYLNRHAAAFMGLLDTFPIMPKKLVVLSYKQRLYDTQYDTFFGYVLRIGGILLRDNNFPDIDVQSVEPQLDLEKPYLYIYFTLVKAVYLHFRGITDQANQCCEKMYMVIVDNCYDSPVWQMVIWSYWLVHRQVSYFL